MQWEPILVEQTSGTGEVQQRDLLATTSSDSCSIEQPAHKKKKKKKKKKKVAGSSATSTASSIASNDQELILALKENISQEVASLVGKEKVAASSSASAETSSASNDEKAKLSLKETRSRDVPSLVTARSNRSMASGASVASASAVPDVPSTVQIGMDVVVEPGSHISPVFRSFWNNVLAISALLDFAAAWSYHFIQNQKEEQELHDSHITVVELPLFLRSLAANHINLGLVFSLLWFLDSFITARENWLRAKQELDRSTLMYLFSSGKEDENKKKVTKSWFGLDIPTAAYYRTIFIQMLFLPVGFFYFVYFVSSAYVKGEAISQFFRWNPPEETYIPHYDTHHHHGHHHHKSVHKEEDQYQTYANLSLIYAIIHLGMVHLGRMLRKEGERQVKIIAVDVAKKALRNPISFGLKVKRILTWARWLKYLIPIIATSNKFYQNFKDMMKKNRQKRQARIALQIRRRLMKERTPEEVRQHAILKLQSVYRARKARRAAAALKVLQGHRETIAAMKMQKKFRALLERSRERIHRKKIELAELQEKQREMASKSKTLSAVDRARMYKLQSELKRQTDYFLTKMLLRPNTRFIVWWKAAFVFAVIFEIGGKIWEPKMKKRYKSYNNMVEKNILPKPWASLPVCNPKPPKPNVVQNMLNGVARIFDKNSNRFQPKNVMPEKPWYCSPNATKVQGAYISSMKFTIRYFHVFMAVVFFLDVFISFFTGEIDEETGVLKPPDFFSRYILPGVLLQCIVNPEMETTAKIIKWTIAELISLGPIRVTRWTVALVVPIIMMLEKVIQKIRLQLVQPKLVVV